MARWWVQGFPPRNKGAEAGLSGYIGRAPKELEPEDNGDWIEVVPADLARELYEAAKVYGMHGEPACSAKCVCGLDAALARYEQEVGDG